MNVINKQQPWIAHQGDEEEAITALKAYNDGPTPFGHHTWLYATTETSAKTRYAWDCGDGHKAHGASIHHAYTQPGEYMATVTARNKTSIMTATTFVIVGQFDVWGSQPIEPFNKSHNKLAIPQEISEHGCGSVQEETEIFIRQSEVKTEQLKN